MPITAREFDRVVRKFGFTVTVRDHVRARLIINGVAVVKTMRSHQGSGDLPSHHTIRTQLKLNEQQLRDAIACPLDREGYLEILRERDII